MFKLVVLSALVAVAVAKPGHLYSGVVAPLAYSAPLVHETIAAVPVAKTVYTAPGATSHTYREDVISKPAKIVSTYEAAPIVQESIAVEAAPLVKYVEPVAPVVAAPAPIIAKTVVSPGSSASTYREDTITKFHPTVEVAAPVVKSVPVVHEVAEAVALPAATSSTYREDIISKPAVVSTYAAAAPVVKSVAYTAPAVTYSAPAVAYSAPAVAYSTPAVAYSAHIASPSLVAGHVAPVGYAASVPAIHTW